LLSNFIFMRKIILSIILLCGIASYSFAQLELKPAIGFTSARFDSDPDSLVADGHAGYQFGASLAIGRKLYIEPGIFYTRLSQKFTPVNQEKAEFTYSANYLRVPVNFGFQFIGSSSSLASLRIYLGPSLFIPMSVKENSYGLTKDDLKSPQVDFSVGAGLNIWFIFLDVSYGWGLTPQFKDDSIEANMQSLYVNLGFRFKLKSDEE
jgi:hypothetical protein